MKRQIHPNLGFCSQCVTCWSNGGDNSPSWKLELRFLKSMSLADQKVETPTSESWNLGFWSHTCWPKGGETLIKSAETPKGRDTLIKRCRHPNLGFCSQCHLLIKRWRQLPLVEVGTWVFEVSVTCWSNSGDTLIKKLHTPKVETPWSKCRCTQRWRHPDQKMEMSKLRFLKSVCHLLIKGGDNSPSWKLELRFLKSVSLADQKAETPWCNKSGDTQR